ncbi:Invs [Symbiodinium natans]|uniref:Invs protein n=1 Tax=Symbiodinium natans TaxID=878477 RepID=A0A812IPH6_9DINO|nr:Invs [Symbiodinium natans]
MGDAFGQQCLLLAWAHIEAAACEEGAAGNLCWERNEITHAMEKAGFSFEQFSRKPDHFPCFCQEYAELRSSNPTAMDVDTVDALTFVRLLALLREKFYESGTGAGADALEAMGLNIREAVRCVEVETGIHLGRAKSVNRLRNAFRHQTARRHALAPKRANQIAKTINDASPCTVEEFLTLASELSGVSLTREELLEDYAVARTGSRP